MIEFLPKEKLLELLVNDPDKYYKTFFKLDLHVRNVDTISEYKEKIKKSVCEFTEKQQYKIIKYTLQIDQQLQSIKLEWFDGKKASLIPWKIGCIKGDRYEYGLPHTRCDVIILPKGQDSLYETLLHEKIHIYQKKYKKEMKRYLSLFTKIKKREEIDRIRANPDIDKWIYKNFKSVYVKNPKTIEDVKGKNEHPFEKMAEQIEKFLL
jgi:hypothetical protein